METFLLVKIIKGCKLVKDIQHLLRGMHVIDLGSERSFEDWLQDTAPRTLADLTDPHLALKAATQELARRSDLKPQLLVFTVSLAVLSGGC